MVLQDLSWSPRGLLCEVVQTSNREAVSYAGGPRLRENLLQLPVKNVISDKPSFADDGGGTRRLAVFSRKSIPSKTQTGPIEGVITSFKNELYFLSQIAYNAKNYLHIFILETVLLNQKNENNSNWTRFIQPVTSPQEQNIELITKKFAYTYE
ncbi:PR domain zinc finger protein 10 [Tyrophagus putrescentiae]|nr:PR domain zinc finger protein 10 [Tyrophagus putrescentiae]